MTEVWKKKFSEIFFRGGGGPTILMSSSLPKMITPEALSRVIKFSAVSVYTSETFQGKEGETGLVSFAIYPQQYTGWCSNPSKIS